MLDQFQRLFFIARTHGVNQLEMIQMWIFPYLCIKLDTGCPAHMLKYIPYRNFEKPVPGERSHRNVEITVDPREIAISHSSLLTVAAKGINLFIAAIMQDP